MTDEVAVLLQEIRDNQREALAVQREHAAMYKAQHARWMRMTRAFYFLVPLIIVVMLMAVWPYLRYFWWWITQ